MVYPLWPPSLLPPKISPMNKPRLVSLLHGKENKNDITLNPRHQTKEIGKFNKSSAQTETNKSLGLRGRLGIIV